MHDSKYCYPNSEVLKNKLNISGLSIVQNNGSVQDVLHYHMHLKPYYNENNGSDIQEIFDILKK